MSCGQGLRRNYKLVHRGHYLDHCNASSAVSAARRTPRQRPWPLRPRPSCHLAFVCSSGNLLPPRPPRTPSPQQFRHVPLPRPRRMTASLASCGLIRSIGLLTTLIETAASQRPPRTIPWPRLRWRCLALPSRDDVPNSRLSTRPRWT